MGFLPFKHNCLLSKTMKYKAITYLSLLALTWNYLVLHYVLLSVLCCEKPSSPLSVSSPLPTWSAGLCFLQSRSQGPGTNVIYDLIWWSNWPTSSQDLYVCRAWVGLSDHTVLDCDTLSGFRTLISTQVGFTSAASPDLSAEVTNQSPHLPGTVEERLVCFSSEYLIWTLSPMCDSWNTVLMDSYLEKNI